MSGGVKSLYAACEALARVGRCTIANYLTSATARWFQHGCRLYDYSYLPTTIVYPEVYQPRLPHITHRVCLALGKYDEVQPQATLTVCRSPEIQTWVARTNPAMPTVVVRPSIDRSTFEYDGRPKQDLICYMTREHKHPETARLLRERYGDRVVEIVNRSEHEVATLLKLARVFVWRGNDREGSPRPPKEALVAGCLVVGLQEDLDDRYCTDFGLKCSDLEQLLTMAGVALRMPPPSPEQRAVVRDKQDEIRDWVALSKRFLE
jgi:hypothetical protein